MNNWIAIIVSALALTVSVLTAWFTLLHRGDLRMTKPTVVFFGPDGGHHDKGASRSSYERCCTAHRGAAKPSRVCTLMSNAANPDRTSQFGFMATIVWRVAAGCMLDTTASLAIITFFFPKTARTSNYFKVNISFVFMPSGSWTHNR